MANDFEMSDKVRIRALYAEIERLQHEIDQLRQTSAVLENEATAIRRRDAEIERLRADLDLRNQTALDRKEIIAKLETEIERLRAALKNLMNDVLEYERVNNLSPNPGKQDCWQSVTEARRALEGE